MAAYVDGSIPTEINHALLGVNADHRAAYETMTNTVFLAAQMDFLANPIIGQSETISNMFNKAAKHYYGVQVAPADAAAAIAYTTALAIRKTYDDELQVAQDADAAATATAVALDANAAPVTDAVTAFMDANPEPPVPTLTDKRMYRKNSAKMETKRYQKELESGSKGLEIVPAAERENVTALKNGLAEYFTTHQNSEPADLLIAESDDLFRTLQIDAAHGARVLFIGKYKTNDDGKVDAYCRFIFLKHTGGGAGPSASANLVIKNNAVVTGSGTGWGVALSKLLRSLFGTEKEFTFAEEARGPDVLGRDAWNPYSTAAEKQTGGPAGLAPVATPAELARQDVADALAAAAGGNPVNSATSATSAAGGPDPVVAAQQVAVPGPNANPAANPFGSGPRSNRGGKSTRRKRKGSRKKGSTKKPVSHKKRKRGASKKRRSLPKKK